MAKMPKVKRYRRKGPDNRIGMILVTAVLLMVFAASLVKIISLKREQVSYDEKQEYYSALVDDEKKRADDLVEFEKYTQTDAYIEEVAKQRFGLVKDGEIIFVAEEQ